MLCDRISEERKQIHNIIKDASKNLNIIETLLSIEKENNSSQIFIVCWIYSVLVHSYNMEVNVSFNRRLAAFSIPALSSKKYLTVKFDNGNSTAETELNEARNLIFVNNFFPSEEIIFIRVVYSVREYRIFAFIIYSEHESACRNRPLHCKRTSKQSHTNSL